VPRYSRHDKVFLAHNGPPPWSCDWCSQLVWKLGLRSLDGHVHHRNEIKLDNRPENLCVMHSRCHKTHHRPWEWMSTPEAREKKSRSLEGHTVDDDTRRKIGDSNRRRFVEGTRKPYPAATCDLCKEQFTSPQARGKHRKTCDGTPGKVRRKKVAA
jgi:hypothetical protein